MQVLVSIGIMGILLLAMVSMLQTQQKELRSIRQKQEAVELKSTMLQQMLKSDICTWQLKDKVIDVSLVTTEASPSPTVVELNVLRQGPDVSSAMLAQAGEKLPFTTTGIRVASISFRHIFATGNANEYTGVFEVSFDESSLAYAIHPVQVQQVIKVVGTDPGNAKRIESCGPGSSLQTGEEDLDSVTPFDIQCEYRWVTSNGYGGPATFKALLVTADRLWWRERDYASTMIYRTNKKVAVGQYSGTITNIFRVCP